jgi:quercetin dioxygenase-like cupin family protein
VRVVRVTKAGRKRSDFPIFVGEVDYQSVIGEESHDLSLSEVTFKRGAVNKPHVHSTDQILVVTDGEGFVATDDEDRDMSIGDVAFIPANTKHWHGARPGKDMTHWSILGNGKTTIVEG